jgi:hypothetical protein
MSPVAESVSRADFDALTQRVRALAAPVPQNDRALSERLDKLDARVAAASDAVDQIKKVQAEPRDAQPAPAMAAAVPSADVSVLEGRIAEIERAVQAVSRQDAQARATDQTRAGDDVSVIRQAIAALALEQAVVRNAPFTERLDAAKRVVPQGAMLQPLDSFASSGLPNDAALCREFLALADQRAPQAASPSPSSAQSGVIERLQAGAARLVHVERVDTPTPSTPDTGGSAITAARRGDLPALRAVLDAMPVPARAPYQSWFDKVSARDRALDAARSYSANAVAALTAAAAPSR